MTSPTLTAKVTALALGFFPAAMRAEQPQFAKELAQAAMTQPAGVPSLAEGDLSALRASCMEEERSWRFLDSSDEARCIEALKSPVPGFRTATTGLNYLPSGELILKLDLTPEPGAKPLTGQAAEQLFHQTILPQHAALGRLVEEERFKKVTIIGFQASEAGGLELRYCCSAGSKSTALVRQNETPPVPGTVGARMAIWNRALGMALRAAIALPRDDISESEKEIVSKLERLRDEYSAANAPLLARLAQCVRVRIDFTVEACRTYADLGLLSPEECTNLPESLRLIVASTAKHVRNLPPPQYFTDLKERTKDVALPPFLHTLLKLEEEGEIRPKRIIDIARLEIRESLRYAREQAGKQKSLSPETAAAIVQRYFSEHFPNDYVFTDSTPGLSAGIAVRRTDCSIRALNAKAMLEEMGFPCGVAVISLGDHGRANPAAISHMVNYIGEGAERIYFDFSKPAGQRCSFTNLDPIKEYYAGPRAGEVLVDFESSDPRGIVERVFMEPILDEVNRFVEAYGDCDGDLSQFLQGRPEFREPVDKMKRYYGAVDSAFGTNTVAEVWNVGTREALLRLFPILEK